MLSSFSPVLIFHLLMRHFHSMLECCLGYSEAARRRVRSGTELPTPAVSLAGQHSVRVLCGQLDRVREMAEPLEDGFIARGRYDVYEDLWAMQALLGWVASSVESILPGGWEAEGEVAVTQAKPVRWREFI